MPRIPRKATRAPQPDGSVLRERLLAEMRRQNLSGMRVAYLLGRSENVVNQFLSGRTHTVSPETCRRLAAVFGWPEDQVLMEAGHRSPPATVPRTERPADPLMLLTECLEKGGWPQNVSSAVYALLAACADDKRRLWQRRFDAAVARLEQEMDESAVVGVNLEATTEEQREALVATARTQVHAAALLLRERLFPSGQE